MTPKIISPKYFNFTNAFFSQLAMELLEYTGINDHAIDLTNNKQLSYGLIYSLGPEELDTLKIYIETNLANKFIRPSKFSVGTLIFFVCKLDGSLCLCIDYQDLNNLTIKNRYSLPLISKSLNWLSHAKQFIQLNLTSTYHRMRILKEEE